MPFSPPKFNTKYHVFWLCAVVHVHPIVAEVVTWKKPAEDWIKINSDGAFNKEELNAGIGIIARDGHGPLMDGSSLPVHCGNALQSEALALKEAAKLAYQRKDAKVEFEIDSLVLSMELQKPERDQAWPILALSSS